MSFSAASLPFLVYAVVHSLFFRREYKRLQIGLKERHCWLWNVCRILLLSGIGFVTLDCLRLFIGGFWGDTDLKRLPSLVGIIFPCELAHLVVLPLFIYVQLEFCVADSKCPRSFVLRGVALLVSLLISLCCGINMAALVETFDDLGYQRSEDFGVVTYTYPKLAVAKERGYLTIADELIGVVTFATAAVIAGAFLWRKNGWPAYFMISLVALLGQAAGPVSKDYFFFASNFFEILSFGGMVLADEHVFKTGSSRDMDPMAGVDLSQGLA
eukprot:TRINITY_DN38117_c0_g1_i1.p1 TRINITY_DN38117_c0_g1~~TRINITY_DN38117_c0_g1_i1.p1  ORF type:complete len:270 (+),score=35.00 TRINITY_DN38117_c0_g1_i1:51-860(+)